MASISNQLESSSATSSSIHSIRDTPSPTTVTTIAPTATTTVPNNAAQPANKRYRAQPPKTFQCRGYGDCKMVFSRSEHLARHVRKHTGERPFTCHCSKQFSRLDNLRQHAQTVHADKVEQNEALMRELSTLHAAMAAGKGRKRNNAASANNNTTQRSPVSPTTPTVPSSNDQQRHSPPHHVAPHNRNLEYPGLATHPYTGQLPVMSNAGYSHLYHHPAGQTHDVHHHLHHHGQPASFRPPSVESSSSHHSFQHQDFHGQSFPASVPTHHQQHNQSFQSDGTYHPRQQQQQQSLASSRTTGQLDSFRSRADSPNSTTSGISPISAIPTLPTPPPTHGIGISSSGRTLDAGHSQQHGSFPFQHYSHGHHGHQSHSQQQRNLSRSPVEGRTVFTGASMESSHGQLVRDGSPSNGSSTTGGVGSGGDHWGSSAAAAYVTLSSAHGIDSRGGSDATGGSHSFRQSSYEHGSSFLGSGSALPSLPSIVGSGSNGPFASSLIGSYGEGHKSLSRETASQSSEFESSSRPTTRDKLPSSRLPSFPLPTGIDTTINVHNRPIPGYGGHLGYNLEARRPGTAPAAYAYGYPRPRTAGAPISGIGIGATAVNSLAAIPESAVGGGNGFHIVPSQGPPRTGILPHHHHQQQQFYHHRHHPHPYTAGGFGPGGESGFDDPGVGALGDNTSPFQFHPPPLSSSYGTGTGSGSGVYTTDAASISPVGAGYAPPSTSSSYAEPPPPTGPVYSSHSSNKRLRTAGIIGISSTSSASSLSINDQRPSTGATSRPQSRRLGVMDLINDSTDTVSSFARFKPPRTSPTTGNVKSSFSSTGRDQSGRLKRSRSPEYGSGEPGSGRGEPSSFQQQPIPSSFTHAGEEVVMRSPPNSNSPPSSYRRSPGSGSIYENSKSSPRSVTSLRASVVAS